MMSDSYGRLWAPVFIGYAVSGFMYGITLGQSICYTLWFPKDPWFTKAFVFVIFLADTIHMIGCTQYLWTLLVACHQNHFWSCRYELPRGGNALVWANSSIASAVQSFYCHRIWTISGKNKPFTLAVFVFAMPGLVFGSWYNVDVVRVGTIDYMFKCPLILYSAATSTTCDILITYAVFKYMWKSGFRRQRSIIQDLALVCINTGAFTCTVSIVVGIVFLVQGDSNWIMGVGILFSRSYVNSLMAVLNARKTLRDRDVNVYTLTPIQATS
ncbi:hypothetical protein HD554DRAFT_784832 [Boletus coccyginus]|nr:hypothetical protein HD554DRAFT_784832 [Boletus coccyginus]